MRTKTVSVLLSILFLVGLNIPLPGAMAVGEPDDPDEVVADDVDDDDNEPLSASQDQSEANSAADAFSNLGTIQVGPSASGQTVRILSTAYTLQPLSGNVCLSCIGVIVGPADLFVPSIIDQLRAAYEAGHAVGLTNATQASIGRLHDLLGHRGSVEPVPGGAGVDLVAFRKAQRADGQFHFSSHILLPRAATADPLTERDKRRLKRVSKAVRRKVRRKLVRQRKLQQRTITDRNDLKALSRIFSATPVIPEPPPGGNPEQNLLQLADDYQSHAIASGFQGSQVQIVNTVWDVRSFLNSLDLYYILQEVDIEGPISAGASDAGASNSLVQPNAAPTTIQPSPQTTGQTTSITSGVSDSIGGSAGWNQMQGLNALVSGGLTISNSSTTTYPPIAVTNNGNLVTGETSWIYFLLGINGRTQLTFVNQWIWEVPFTAYSAAQQNITFNSQAFLGILTNSVTANLNSVVPLPFGDVFALQQPAVTGVSPSSVGVGDEFTVTGTGFYPSLVTAVLIGGTAVNPANITAVSDTQINVIAPSFDFCELGCTVVVQTTQGTSNHNVTISIIP